MLDVLREIGAALATREAEATDIEVEDPPRFDNPLAPDSVPTSRMRRLSDPVGP